MDIQMANMDGVTATRRIRSLSGPAGRVPIIGMTANVLPQQVQAFRAAGMNDHVGKPFRRIDLLTAIARATATAPVMRQMPPTAKQAAPVLDPEVFAGVTGLLGRDKLNDMLARLGARLKNPFPVNPESATQWATVVKEAHNLVSTAGLLGFVNLSESCARLEAATLEGQDDVAAVLDEVREACHAAFVEIAARMGTLEDAERSRAGPDSRSHQCAVDFPPRRMSA
jgi:HPt (histidine-containing phosphotransfer) domain-containing protein